MSILTRLQYGGQCDLPAVPHTDALEISEVSYRYPNSQKKALENVTLHIQPGERLALVGPNGAGKSTLLQLILGMKKEQQGAIRVYGNPAHHCRHRVAIVPQRASVDWNFPLTVRQVVTMGRYVHLGWMRRPGNRDKEKVDEAMETMGISDLSSRQISQLSGGQQQRVMLARTLAHDADLLLLDEPLNHVDIKTQELIFHTIERLSKAGKTAIVSTHDLGVLTVHFNRAVFLDRRVIADGPVDEVITPRTIAKAYGFEFHKDYHND
ncbi:metal ABC transporter ATP-binding protein [Salinispira pacifica]|uniref:Manganese ABC transporter, ATP-binding protein SitB n=1 Tax=Salinispira pacifica TaxID=1307761 RepID=V5WIZ5_9SPIO|nr:ABC transporter ATP-binding protein [Salinispira pacifica]AHC15812.1 Manganese ABC transporter, ATP-binding protein SitB [Salinispira pacifica]